MNLDVIDVRGRRVGEGPRGERLVASVDDAAALVEACLSHGIDRLLLYPENLTPNFFDLSSGEAGAILQKLRNYHIRLAVVRTPTLRLSSRFGEMLADERHGPYFRLFEARRDATAWLRSA